MAIRFRKPSFYAYFDPFKMGQIGLKLDARTKSEARQIEAMILRACRTGDYSLLDGAGREACIRMFTSKGWELPVELGSRISRPTDELTLWKASELFMHYPEIKASKTRWRYHFALSHVTAHFGKERPIKSIWISDLKAYQIERQNDKAAASSINWELATLSKLFGVMIEMQLLDSNPVMMLKRLSTKSEERQVHLSKHTVHLIADRCPGWYQLVIWTAYYTGMRRGEIFDLTRKQVNLKDRIITLWPQDTKEAHWKRIPIHQELVPYLKEALRLPSLTSDRVFLVRDGQGTRGLGKDTIKNPWPRACQALEKAKLLEKPFPRFHDLRHTWKTNARRSGMDPEIREAVLGHAERGKSVVERYGRISNEELVRAVDLMTFDHGETEILVASSK